MNKNIVTILVMICVSFCGLQCVSTLHNVAAAETHEGYLDRLPLDLSNHIKRVPYAMCGMACSDINTIYITDVLLRTCGSYEEFLFAVVHEEAHIVLGHAFTMRAMKGNPDGFNEDAYYVASRSQEYQADKMAAMYLKSQGFTTKACKLLRRLGSFPIETTHPSSEKRYAQCVKVWE